MEEPVYDTPVPIRVASGPDAVRQRPGMYFGDVEAEGLGLVLGEAVSNGFDQVAAGHATEVKVDVGWDDAGQAFRVADDGAGLPFEVASDEGLSLATRYLTRLHATPTADGHAPHLHIHALHGVGLFATNAVCRELTVTSWRDGHRWQQRFSRGLALGPPTSAADSQGRGTLIEGHVDPEIWGPVRFDVSRLRAEYFTAAHLVKGLRLVFNGEVFQPKAGLAELLRVHHQQASWLNTSPVFHWRGRVRDFELEVAAVGDLDHWAMRQQKPRLMGWVNGQIAREAGSDRRGISRALSDCGWRPELVMSHVIMHAPKWASPTKDKLHAPHVARGIRKALAEPLAAFVAAHGLGKQA